MRFVICKYNKAKIYKYKCKYKIYITKVKKENKDLMYILYIHKQICVFKTHKNNV